MADREAELKIKATADFADAKEATSGLSESVEKLGESGKEATSSLQATTQATDGLAKNAQEAASAARSEAEALDGATVAAKEQSAAIEAAGNAATEFGAEARAGAMSAAEAYGKMGEALRGSGGALEVQKIGLQAIISEVQELTTSYVRAGDAEQANLSGEVLTGLKARLADVNGEIQEQINALRTAGDAGKQGYGEIKNAAASFEQIAEGATKAVNASWAQLNENFKITPRQLGAVAQAVESMRIAMVEAAEQGTVATKEQIAIYERLENQLTQLTQRANLLTNAAKDNAVRLGETGKQVSGLAFGIQNLTQMMGPNAAQFGILAANAGLLGSTAEDLKDSYAAMGLGSISAASSATALGVAVAGSAAAFAVGAAAGKALAETSELNAQAFDRLKEKVTSFTRDALNDVVDRLGALQEAMQTYIAEQATFDISKPIESLERQANAFEALRIANDRGSDALKAYWNLINAGIGREEAYAIAIEKGSKAVELFSRAHEQGGRSVELWDAAVAKAKANGGSFGDELKKLETALNQEAEATKKNAGAKQQLAEATAKAEQYLKSFRDAQDQSKNAMDAALLAVAALDQAHNGTTETINQAVTAIQAHIAASATDSAQLGIYAGALQQILDKTAALAPAERERIQNLIDLAQKGAELTTTEQARAAALATAIVSETAAAASVKAHADVTKALTDRKTEQVAATSALQSAQVAVIETTTAAIAATDAELTSIGASTETINRYNQSKAELAELTKSLSNENINYSASQEKANKVVSDGAGGFTNLTTEQQKASAGMSTLEAATKKAGETFTSTIVRDLETGKITITNVATETEKAGGKFDELKTKGADSAAAVAKGLESVGTAAEALPNSLGALSTFADGLKLKLLEVEQQAMSTAAAVRSVGSAVDSAAASAAAASGGGYNSNPIGPRDVAGDF